MNKPEQQVQNILTSLGLDGFFQYNYKFKQYRIDFADPVNKIAVEVMGTYWHGHILLKNKDKKKQEKRTKNRIKRTALENSDWFCIFIWEHSLKNIPEKVKNYLEQNILGNIKI